MRATGKPVVEVGSLGQEEHRIAEVEAMLLRVPIPEPVSGASARPGVTPRALESWDLIVITLRTRGGVEGVGLTYELRAGGSSVLTAVREDVAPLLMGEDCLATEHIWERLYWATADVGRRGALLHAISAADIALWDAKARALGVSLARLLGADRTSVPAYESDSGWLSLSTSELARRNATAIESGMRAVKISVGLPDARFDAERVAAVRRAIGDHALLLLDAGQKWDVPTALERLRRFEEYDVYWLEEPIPCDDVEGHARLAAAAMTRIAAGQSLTSRFEFGDLLARRAVDIVQADAARVGGVTEWWRIAHLADAAHAQLAPHFLEELHVSLVAAAPRGAWVEHTPWLSPLLDDPPTLIGGHLSTPDGPGHGLRFSSEALRHRIA